MAWSVNVAQAACSARPHPQADTAKRKDTPSLILTWILSPHSFANSAPAFTPSGFCLEIGSESYIISWQLCRLGIRPPVFLANSLTTRSNNSPAHAPLAGNAIGMCLLTLRYPGTKQPFALRCPGTAPPAPVTRLHGGRGDPFAAPCCRRISVSGAAARSCPAASYRTSVC